MDIQKREKKNSPMSVHRPERDPMAWEEPEIVELSRDPEAGGVCAAVGSAAAGGCAFGAAD
jgi:hypothetical protein